MIRKDEWDRVWVRAVALHPDDVDKLAKAECMAHEWEFAGMPTWKQLAPCYRGGSREHVWTEGEKLREWCIAKYHERENKAWAS